MTSKCLQVIAKSFVAYTESHVFLDLIYFSDSQCIFRHRKEGQDSSKLLLFGTKVADPHSSS